MFDSQAYLRMENYKRPLQEEFDKLNQQIRDLRELAKKEEKGSERREELNMQAGIIKLSKEYRELEMQINTINYCINCLYYS